MCRNKEDVGEYEMDCPYLRNRPPVDELIEVAHDCFDFEYRMNRGKCPLFCICRQSDLYLVCSNPQFFCDYLGLIPSIIADGVAKFETFYAPIEGELIIDGGSVFERIRDTDGLKPLTTPEEVIRLIDSRKQLDRRFH